MRNLIKKTRIVIKHMKEDIKYKEYINIIENYNSKNDKQVRRMLSEKEFKIFMETTENIPESTKELIVLIKKFTRTKEYIKRRKDNRLMNPKKTTLREDLGEEEIKKIKEIHRKLDKKSKKKY